MEKKYLNKKQKGQAMVETAIMLPLLVLLLLGVGYFGSAITTLHNLSVAARYSARAVAIDSSMQMVDRTTGTYFIRLTDKTFKDFAMQSLPGFDPSRLKAQVIAPDQIASIMSTVKSGKLQVIPESKGYAYVYKKTGKADAVTTSLSGNVVPQLRAMPVGIGCIFFGVRLTYRLKELDWLSKFLFKKKEGITIEAVSMMPAELPLRSIKGSGTDFGLMNINEGIFKMMRVNVRNDNEAKAYGYEDLIKVGQ